MKRWVLLVALALSTPVMAQAQFCVVTTYSEDCWYQTANDCRRAARDAGGACVVKQQAQQPNNTFSNFLRGYESGSRIAAEREQQRPEPQPVEVPAPVKPPSQVAYRCDHDGGRQYTTYPRVGCVVIHVVP